MPTHDLGPNPLAHDHEASTPAVQDQIYAMHSEIKHIEQLETELASRKNTIKRKLAGLENPQPLITIRHYVAEAQSADPEPQSTSSQSLPQGTRVC